MFIFMPGLTHLSYVVNTALPVKLLFCLAILSLSICETIMPLVHMCNLVDLKS